MTGKPKYIATPTASNRRNGGRLRPIMPERTTAILPRPGTNLANRRAIGPIRVNKFSLCRTQESGETEILQKNARRRLPTRTPARYHPRSAIKAAAAAVKRTLDSDGPWAADRAPAIINAGYAGRGKPVAFTSTLTHTIKREKSWIADGMLCIAIDPIGGRNGWRNLQCFGAGRYGSRAYSGLLACEPRSEHGGKLPCIRSRYCRLGFALQASRRSCRQHSGVLDQRFEVG